jgi:hypothetical protein
VETAYWSTITQIYEGTNQIQRMVIDRQLHKSQKSFARSAYATARSLLLTAEAIWRIGVARAALSA